MIVSHVNMYFYLLKTVISKKHLETQRKYPPVHASKAVFKSEYFPFYFILKILYLITSKSRIISAALQFQNDKKSNIERKIGSQRLAECITFELCPSVAQPAPRCACCQMSQDNVGHSDFKQGKDSPCLENPQLSYFTITMENTGCLPLLNIVTSTKGPDKSSELV